MPRTTRNSKEKKTLVKETKRVKQVSVANVNKNGQSRSAEKTALQERSAVKRKLSVEKRKGKQDKTTKKSKIPVSAIQKKQKEQAVVTSLSIRDKYKKANVPKITIQNSEAILEGYEDNPIPVSSLVQTEFSDGEQMINLQVEGDESYAGSSLNSFNEDSENSSSEDDSESESNRSMEEAAEERSPKFSGRSPRVTAKDREAQIEDIDMEITHKIKELSQLIHTGGMKNSEKALAECFGISVSQGNSKNANRRKSQISGEVSRKLTQMRLDNANDNHFAEIVTELPRSKSLETIYKNAVEKRISSSSDKCVDISDENLNLDFFIDGAASESFLAKQTQKDFSHLAEQEPEPGTSGYQSASAQPTAAQKARQTILEGEAAKAKIFPNPPGKTQEFSNDFRFIAQMDQDYLVIGAHVDDAMKSKIIKGEYVDFGKLLPKDRIQAAEEDGKVELVIRNGKTFWMPVSDSVAINGFAKWEQAFRIFSNIYTKVYPHKSTELIQYNHVIHSISSQYSWDNIYSYDKEFRMHLANHPKRSWAGILQQAWSMKLRDRLYKSEGGNNWNASHANHFHKSGGNSSHTGNHNAKGKSNEPCRRFNRGKCNFGPSCMFEHHCAYTPCN